MYKRVLWSYGFTLNENSGATAATFTNMPYVRGCAFRVIVSAGRFGIVQLGLPGMASMPAGYEEKDLLVTNGEIFVNNSVFEFFVESIQNLTFNATMTVDQDGTQACSIGVVIQQVELFG
jgi:hypothetical protein